MAAAPRSSRCAWRRTWTPGWCRVPCRATVVELGADDLDLDFYTNDQLDLTRIVETETSLALPMKSLCRSDCRGLCPVCGVNRNAVPCACAPRPPDPRLAVLRDFATRLSN